MTRFFLKRMLTAAAQILIVVTIVFFALHMMPGDPVMLMLSGDGSSVDPEAYQLLYHELGLDLPLHTQYIHWIQGLFSGDLGMSYSEQIPVVEAIALRLPRTLELAFAALILSCLIGIPLGIISANRRGSFTDLSLTVFSSLGNSIPVYVFGYILVVIFALWLNLLPSSGYVMASKSVAEHYRRMILPACALALSMASSTLRMTRSSMLEAMASESITPLRAKGLSRRYVICKHVMRNMLIPVVTIIGLQMGNLIAGTVLCEAMFNWPGIATLLVNAINNRDYPLIQGCMLVMSAIFVLINMTVDLLYGVLDPRTR